MPGLLEAFPLVANEHNGLSTSQRMLMLALASHGGPNSQGIFPSVGSLAGRTAMSERAVQSNLHELDELGVLAIERQAHRSHRYGVQHETLRARIAAGQWAEQWEPEPWEPASKLTARQRKEGMWFIATAGTDTTLELAQELQPAEGWGAEGSEPAEARPAREGSQPAGVRPAAEATSFRVEGWQGPRGEPAATGAAAAAGLHPRTPEASGEGCSHCTRTSPKPLHQPTPKKEAPPPQPAPAIREASAAREATEGSEGRGQQAKAAAPPAAPKRAEEPKPAEDEFGPLGVYREINGRMQYVQIRYRCPVPEELRPQLERILGRPLRGVLAAPSVVGSGPTLLRQPA